MSLSGPVAQTFDSAIHWINDFSERERERERDSITRASRPILDPTAPSFLLVQIKPRALEGEWARPIPEPLGSICNEPVARLSFQDHLT